MTDPKPDPAYLEATARSVEERGRQLLADAASLREEAAKLRGDPAPGKPPESDRERLIDLVADGVIRIDGVAPIDRREQARRSGLPKPPDSDILETAERLVAWGEQHSREHRQWAIAAALQAERDRWCSKR